MTTTPLEQLTAREQVLRDYSVDQNGIIRSPGKFEGEPVFVPHFWQLALEGFSDRDNGRIYTFRINLTGPERSEWPELAQWLGRKRAFNLIENEQGFVHCF